MHQLNLEQRQVAKRIEAMRSGDRFVVSGRAGSGKTYGIARSVVTKRALFLAPTHPARTVLEKELKDTPHSVTTIHSAIGWYPLRDETLGRSGGYRPAKKARRLAQRAGAESGCPFANVDIVIADEFSMIGSFLFRAVEEYAKEFNLPVVYSGDRFQLPPVDDREVIMKQGFDTITLNSSIRFPESSEIYRLGEMLRRTIEEDPDRELPLLTSSSSVLVTQGRQWIDTLTDSYAQGHNLLAVAHDNQTLRRLRQKVRKTRHDRLVEGDHVLSSQTDGLFRNGEEFTVSSTSPDSAILCGVPACVSRERKLALPCYRITFRDTDRVAFTLEDHRQAKRLDKRICELHDNGKLTHAEAARILDWLDSINRFELSALSTVHKSQGRSVDTVYIDTATVLRRPSGLSPRDHKRLLYTAITRARKQVIFYEMAGYCEQAPGAEIIPFRPAPANPTSGQPQSRAA